VNTSAAAAEACAAAIERDLRRLTVRDTRAIRAIRRTHSRALKTAPAGIVLEAAQAMCRR
jgi:hypothetical protein